MILRNRAGRGRPAGIAAMELTMLRLGESYPNVCKSMVVGNIANVSLSLIRYWRRLKQTYSNVLLVFLRGANDLDKDSELLISPYRLYNHHNPPQVEKDSRKYPPETLTLQSWSVCF